MMKRLKTEKNCDSKRAEELFQCLLLRYDLQRLTDKFPTVREIRATFRCGQTVATAVLNRLAEYYHFKRYPRGKSRLALDLSSADRETVWETYQYQRSECSIILLQDIAFCWQPIIDEYNKLHPHRPLRTHLIYHTEEFISQEQSDTPVDLLLLPNHPALIGFRNGLSGFKDLTQLARDLPVQDYYNTLFLYDKNCAVRGIAPALVPKIWMVKKDMNAHVPKDGFEIGELQSLLRVIKEQDPSLQYGATIDSYLSFFAHCGLDMARSMENGFRDWKRYDQYLKLFRSMYLEGLVPSVCDLINSGYSSFVDHQTAIIELYYSKIPRFRNGIDFEFMLPPRQGNMPYPVSSEVLTVNQSSIRYEQAWEFIVFTLQPHIQQLLLSRMNAFSVLRDLKPCRMEEAVYRRILPMLQNSRRLDSDQIMLPALFRCFESSIDSLVKYGGNIRHFQKDFRNLYETLNRKTISAI